jgi:uncharacterized membrane protein (UPF0136 family)
MMAGIGLIVGGLSGWVQYKAIGAAVAGLLIGALLFALVNAMVSRLTPK